MEIALLKDEALRLKRITKDTIKQAGTLEWEKMEIYTQ